MSSPAPSAAPPQVALLDDPERAEATLLALLQGRTDTLITQKDSGAPAPVVKYAREWLKLVGMELKDEINEALNKRPRGLEATVTVLGPVKDAKDAVWLTVQTKEKSDEDETPDPPTMHMLVMSTDPLFNVIFYISGYQPDRRGDKYRAMTFDVEALRQNKTTAPRTLPSTKVKCIEVASASTALNRVQVLTSVQKLNPSLAAALIADEKLSSAEPPVSQWRALEATDASQQSQLSRLNTGQRAALCGLDGPVSVVQGPPGTGKSSFITAACLARVPAGARILACTATNKAIDSLVAKLESAGLTDMLCVGSRRAMGEASCRYLMSSVLGRQPKLAEAEAAYELHSVQMRKFEAELRALPKPSKPTPPLPPLPPPGSAGDKPGKGGGKGGRGAARKARGKGGGKGGRGGGKTLESLAAEVEARPANVLDEIAAEVAGAGAMEAGGGDGGGGEAAEEEEEQAMAPAPAPLSPEEAAAAEAAAARAAEDFKLATATYKVELAEFKEVEVRRSAVKDKLKSAQDLARKNEQLAGSIKANARRHVWQGVRLVACTASAALQVTRRLKRDMEEEGGMVGKDSAEAAPLTFDFVILDEAAAMLEVDALGCLLHGARAILLVGDQQQLPPFSKWKDADTHRYTVSLMARLAGTTTGRDLGKPSPVPPRRAGGKGEGMPALLAAAAAAAGGKGGKGGGKGGNGANGEAGGPVAFMLTEQYRMHPAINKIVSSTFYFSKLQTAPVTARQREHPMPASFVNLPNGREEFNERSCYNKLEAEEVVAIAAHNVHYLGFAPERINILTFYNAQRDLLERLVTRDNLGVAVLSVDSMQGREADVIVLSCVRADVAGGLGFVADARRVNVALSRAREALVVVGSARCLEVERIWHSTLKGLQPFGSAREHTDAIEAALPHGWARPRVQVERDPRAERTSADREFEDVPSPPKPGVADAKLAQRDSGDIPDDWDASSDDEDGKDEASSMEGTVALS